MSPHGPFLVVLLIQGPSGQPPARPWALTADWASPITVPSRTRNIVLAALDYEPTDTVKGAVVDLNRDGSPDYIIDSAPRLCGTGGCPYLIVDGAKEGIIARLFGAALYIQAEESHGYPTITSYYHMGAESVTYTRWAFDGREFRQTSSRPLAGASLDSLFAVLRRIPTWKPPL